MKMLFLLMILWQFVTAGVAVKLLWGWFITPFGLPALSVAHGVGIAILASFCTIQYIPRTDEEQRKAFLFETLLPLLAIACGFIAHLLM
ncbi:MAG: hypothetical protein KGI50_03320 [Patescibacteria group bacterium]|nr:hypothetical protein [Patescibacteria group bacterium]MDE2438321.1 hypothetical protein [Patescibacteria group bacterium]